MLSILQMDLEISHSRLRPRGIQLAGAVMTSYPGQVHPLYALGRRLAGWRGRAWLACGGIHRGVLHRPFEVIGGILGQEAVEPLSQPVRRRWWCLVRESASVCSETNRYRQ